MRILLAIDDSRFSEAAVNMVIDQVRPEDTEVRVLHVLESPPLLVARGMGGYEPALEAALESRKEQAEELVAKNAELLRARGLKVVATLEVGDTRSKILDLAEEWHADLIVVGSHGRKRPERFLMGGVSDAVARHARCSVEIVRVLPTLAASL